MEIFENESKRRGIPARLGQGVLTLFVLGGLAVVLVGCPAFVNQPPVAIADATPTSGEAPLTVQFDGSASYDPDGAIASFQWDFNGDGTPDATTQTASYEFTAEGTYLVVLTVTDNLGKRDSDKVIITVGRTSIYFSTNRLAGDFDIFRMNADGTGAAQVTSFTSGDEITPALVPNTRDKLAYASDQDAPVPGFFDIFVSEPDGTLPANLTATQTMSSQIQPSWSPDGMKVAFASDETGNWNIFLMDADGSNVTQLTSVEAGGKAVAPAFSPDGTKIAFAADCNTITVSVNQAVLMDCGNDFEIFTMTIDAGGNVTAVAKLTNNTFNDGALDNGALGLPFPFGISTPSWSPDGAQIAFTSDRDGPDLDIFLMDAEDGSNVTQLTSSSFDDFDPYWLPSGDAVVFVSDRDGGVPQIFKIDVVTKAVTQLTTSGMLDVSPASVESQR